MSPVSPDVKLAETVGKIIVPESVPQNNQSPTDKAAVELKEILDKEGADLSLKSAANRRVDKNSSSRSIDENIGNKRDEEGKMIRDNRSPEKTRHDDAKTVEARVTQYLDGGYDSLSDAQKLIVKGDVEKAVLTIPALREQYNHLGANERTAYLEKIARDPSCSQFVAETMNGIVDSAKIKQETISQLTLQLEGLNNELQIVQDQLSKGKYAIEKRINKLKKDIQDLESGTSDDKLSKRNSKIVELKGEKSNIDTTLESLRETRDDTKVFLDTLKEARIQLKKFRGTDKVEIGGREYNLKQIETEIKAQTALYNERNLEYTQSFTRKEEITLLLSQLEIGGGVEGLKEELDKNLEEEAKLKTKKADLENKIKAKKQELGTAKTNRTYDEEQFVNSLKNVFTEAAGKYFEAEVSKAETKVKTYLEQKSTDLKEEAESALAKGLLLRYYFDKTNKVNLKNIRDDKDKIVTIGPEEILKQGLKDGGYTEAQINELIKDKTKWNSLMTKTAEVSLKYYWLKGGLFGREGKMQLDEQMKIVNSPWGNEVLKNSVEAARKDVEAVLKQKLPDRSRIGEWLRKLDGKWLLAIIAILVGLGYFALK